MPPIVLHADADAFFCQVEVLRNPALAGKPVAILQQYDVISVDHQARALGVRKHMPPAEARAILERHGGRLVPAYSGDDNRTSYRPYREVSGALMKLLRRFVTAAVVEKASIDEAYILCQAPPGMDASTSGGGGGGGADGAEACEWDLSAGVRLGCAIRDASRSELGVVLSVGVATNKLLAKLASRAAKPDGLLALDTAAAVRRLLRETPISRLPGVGPAVADALAAAGLSRASDLATRAPEELAAAAAGGALAAPLAARLAEMGRGRDDSAVVDRGPPKSIQVQMTLTWSNLANHATLKNNGQQQQQRGGPGSGTGGPAGSGGGGALRAAPEAPAHLLMTGQADTLPRVTAIVGALQVDLLGRVVCDRHTEDRWPGKLGLRLAVALPGSREFKAISKSCPFPPPRLLHQTTPPAHGEGDASAGNTGNGAGGGGGAEAAASVRVAGVVGERSWAVPAALRDAVVAAAAALAQRLLQGQPGGTQVGQVALAATAFRPFDAACNGDIASFFQKAPPAVPAPAAAESSGGGGGGRAGGGGTEGSGGEGSGGATRAAEGSPAAADRHAGESPPAIQQQQQQQQQQQRGKKAQPTVQTLFAVPAARQPAAARPAPPPAPAAPAAAAGDGLLLSQVLRGLPAASAAEARQQLEEALRRHGAAPLVLPPAGPPAAAAAAGGAVGVIGSGGGTAALVGGSGESREDAMEIM